MKKRIRNIALLLFGALMLHSCFKEVVDYTIYNVAVYNQSSDDGATTPATDLDSYAYYVDTTAWRIASYEDALAGRITNKTTGEVKSQPDVLGTFDSEAAFQVSMRLEQELSMLVIVNPTLRLYAYRSYELPENLSQVDTKLYMLSWRASHSASGWRVVNDFYGIEEEPSDEPTDTPSDEPTDTPSEEDTPATE